MRPEVTSMVFLSLASSALAVDANRFLWFGSESSSEPEVVEVVEWRQAVCVLAGKDVPPCPDRPREFAKGLLDDEVNRSKIKVNANDDRKIGFTDIGGSLSLVGLQSSELEIGDEYAEEKTTKMRRKTPEMDDDRARTAREARDRENGRRMTQPPKIYVTKALDSAVTATLVAQNCLPDIGLPLCEDRQEVPRPVLQVFNSEPSLSGQHTSNSFVHDEGQLFTLSSKKPFIGAAHTTLHGARPEVVIGKPSYGEANPAKPNPAVATVTISVPRIDDAAR